MPIYDCSHCGCRFTNRDEHAYEKLHGSKSTYATHKSFQSSAEQFFLKNDVLGLANYLREVEKNKFIISHLENNKGCQRVLEFGCSRGYLSAYSILLGKEFYGIEVSDTAIQSARESFGPHFYSPDFLEKLPRNYFDCIYHVGTIGCVDDPIEFVNEQLKLLRPGGVLLFNAPNLDVCYALNSLWLSGALPPDLVTLFPSKFWEERFSDAGDVSVILDMDFPLASFRRRRSSSRMVSPSSSMTHLAGHSFPVASPIYKYIRRSGIQILNALVPKVGLFSPLCREFGVFVKIVVR